MTVLAKLANNDQVINEILENGGIEMLESLPENLFDYLKFLRALALMVGKMAAKNKEA